jgi:hypothetical protein
MVRLAAQKANVEIVGAIDLVNLGRDLGEVAKLDENLSVSISNEPDRVLRETAPQVVLHATSSSVESTYPQLKSIVSAGVKKIISSCEELAYPYVKHPELTASVGTTS